MSENNKGSKNMDNGSGSSTVTGGSPGKSMWRNPPWSLIIAAIILLGVVILVAVTHEPTNNGTKAAKRSAQIAVTGGKFFPAVIDVQLGSAVTWTNQEDTPHWVASDPYPKDDTLKSLNSGGPLQQNESYTYTFDKSGTYTYHDELHPQDLMGTIRVK